MAEQVDVHVAQDAAPLACAVDAAYNDAPAGYTAYSVSDTSLTISVLTRSTAPMGLLVAIPPAAALGLLDGLHKAGAPKDSLALAWPQSVVAAQQVELAHVSSKAGYADGLFVALQIDISCAQLATVLGTTLDIQNPTSDTWKELVKTFVCAVLAQVDSWEEAVSAGRAQAGPWAPFLDTYFDKLALAGKPVDVCYPNGTVYARGTLAGIDVWGQLTVRTKRAGELEFPAERFCVRPQSI